MSKNIGGLVPGEAPTSVRCDRPSQGETRDIAEHHSVFRVKSTLNKFRAPTMLSFVHRLSVDDRVCEEYTETAIRRCNLRWSSGSGIAAIHRSRSRTVEHRFR